MREEEQRRESLAREEEQRRATVAREAEHGREVRAEARWASALLDAQASGPRAAPRAVYNLLARRLFAWPSGRA